MAQIRKPEVVRYRGAACTSREDQPEGAAQSYEAAAFVYLDSNGKLVENSSTPATLVTEGVYAIDTLAASGTEDNPRNVEPLTSDYEVKMSVYHATPASAVTAQNLVGQDFEITKVTVGGVEYWVVDIGGTTNPGVKVTKIAPEFPLGEQYGTVYAKVLKSLLQYQP